MECKRWLLEWKQTHNFLPELLKFLFSKSCLLRSKRKTTSSAKSCQVSHTISPVLWFKMWTKRKIIKTRIKKCNFCSKCGNSIQEGKWLRNRTSLEGSCNVHDLNFKVVWKQLKGGTTEFSTYLYGTLFWTQT